MNNVPVILAVISVFMGVAVAVLWIANRRLGQRAEDLRTENATLQGRLQTAGALADERAALLDQTEERLAAAFGRLAGESLSLNSETFLRLAEEKLGRQQEKARSDLTEREQAVANLVKPIQDALERTQKQLTEIEKARQESYGGIRTQLAAMTVDQQTLQQETRNLVNALRRPQVRGQWGEITLRRVAELAGMVEHCDFVEQETVQSAGGNLRPDMIVKLPDRGVIVVDVKTPLEAYLEAVEARTDEERRIALQRHARNVMDRVRELSAKAYWAQFPTSPEFVILFIPGDQFLSAALSENPALLEDALRSKVLLATPTSLVALLKAIAYGWREVSLAENAEQIRHLAEELYERLTPFTEHLGRLGRQLDGTVKAFNEAVGSMERRILPSARRLAELGIGRGSALPEPVALERTVVAVTPAGLDDPLRLAGGTTSTAAAPADVVARDGESPP